MIYGAQTSTANQEAGISAAFLRNHHGKVCIAFSDPAYVRSDVIVINPEDMSVYAILHESAHFISQVSETMARALAENTEALLTCIRNDGSVFELSAPVQIGHA